MKKSKENDIDLQQNNSKSKLSVADRIIDEKQLKLKLLRSPEDKIQERFSDKNLDRKNEIELLSGRFINIEEEQEAIRLMIATALKDYSPRVPQEYYKQIFRLNGWKIPEGKIKEKPSAVGKYTNEIIYSRYNRVILPELKRLNPYVTLGKRNFKHFQLLTEEGQALFDVYVNDAIEVMKQSSDWYDFRIKHSQKFGVTFQLDLLKERERADKLTNE